MKPAQMIAAALLVVVGLALFVVPSSSDSPIGEAERVLVVSIPTLTWDRVADEQPPNLTAFFEQAAVASASIRTIGADTNLGEGYGTIGAGNRASIPPGAGSLAFPPDVEFDGELVRNVYERRFGLDPEGAEVLQIGAASIQRRNDDLLYDTEVGSLGAAVRAEGGVVGVVGNADLESEPPVEDLHRESVLAVMDDAGRVPLGRVDQGLLETGVDTPLGVRLDNDAVVEASTEIWEQADLLLVELSDLLRAEAGEVYVTPDVAEAAERDALRQTDELFGALVEMTDPERDMVLVLAPTSPSGADQLVVSAIAGPDVEPGLARSGTTRRDGYVTLPDMAPTILNALGIEKPDVMNGATMAAAGGGPNDESTYRSLADDNEKALFRNALSGPLTVIFIVSQVLTYGFAAFALTTHREGWRRPTAIVLLAGMAVPFMSFLVGVFPYWRLSVGGALVAVFAGAAILALAVRAGVRRGTERTTPAARALLPPLVIMAATAILLVADIVVGGPLQIDTAFGYGGGAIVAGRFAGYGNLAWALMVAALIITVTALWGRWMLQSPSEPPSGERRISLGLAGGAFALAVLAVGLPTLGANVGGTLSVVSGLCITMLALAGIRLDFRKLVLVGFATVGVLGVFGAIDVTRDPEDQTHLGRLIDQTLGDDGLEGLSTVIQRKIQSNLNILFSSVWSFVIPAAFAFLAFLIWRPPRFLRSVFAEVPGMRACVIGVLATGLIGGIVNDSGIAIPAIMLTLLLPHAAYLIVETGVGVPDTGAIDEPEPDRA